jgi:hypothetical protein
MPSLYDKLKSDLEINGLHAAHLDAIMPLVVNDESFISMRQRWSDDADGYPLIIAVSNFISARPIAYKWICENVPDAWFRPVFSPGITGLTGAALDEYLENYNKAKEQAK